MTEDREVLASTWEGKVPVQVNLAQEDNPTFARVESLFLLVPRVSYFPLFADRIRKHFERHLQSSPPATGIESHILEASASGGDGQAKSSAVLGTHHTFEDLWLESNSHRTPLRWHYPVGVLFDLFGEDRKLPWEITVHFTRFPAETVMRLPSKEAVESLFLSTVKEACAVKQKSPIVSAMQRKEHSQLWLGLINDRFDQFWSVNRLLMPRAEDQSKPVPIRVLDSEGRTVQRLIKGDVTFSEALSQLGVQGKETTLVQGIQIPFETPLHWMACNLSHPDNFLYVSLRS